MVNALRVISHKELLFQGKPYRCAVGERDFTNQKSEGDKATPVGRFALRECWYRADRIATPETILPLRVIHEYDGWCDDPDHPLYNTAVKRPFPAPHERLWREDHIYDILVTLGYNDAPVMPGRGSAIFFHLARPDYSPTLGCVAVLLPDMLEILQMITAETIMIVAPLMNVVRIYSTE